MAGWLLNRCSRTLRRVRTNTPHQVLSGCAASGQRVGRCVVGESDTALARRRMMEGANGVLALRHGDLALQGLQTAGVLGTFLRQGVLPRTGREGSTCVLNTARQNAHVASTKRGQRGRLAGSTELRACPYPAHFLINSLGVTRHHSQRDSVDRGPERILSLREPSESSLWRGTAMRRRR